MAASTGSEHGHAALVGMVAVQVNVALGAAAEALLDVVRAGAAEARELQHAELPSETRHELRRGQALEAVGQPEVENRPHWPGTRLRRDEVAVAERGLQRPEPARRGRVNLLPPTSAASWELGWFSSLAPRSGQGKRGPRGPRAAGTKSR